MGKMIVDATTSLDGFWSDVLGHSVFSPDELTGSGLSGRLPDTYGAVVMSYRSYMVADDVSWISGAYTPEIPVFVVADTEPVSLANGFYFTDSFNAAFQAARGLAGERAVLVVGEASALAAALDLVKTGETVEIYLRIKSRLLGKGRLLCDDNSLVDGFYVSQMDVSGDAVHLRLKPRQTH